MTPASMRVRLALIGLLASVCLACGGADAPADGGAAATSAAPQNRIVGTWDADMRAMMTAAMPPGQAAPPDVEEMVQKTHMTVEFTASGVNNMTSNMGGTEKTEKGKWELVSQDGNTYKLKLTSMNADLEEKIQDGTAVFTDDDNVRITMVDGGPALVLKRRK